MNNKKRPTDKSQSSANTHPDFIGTRSPRHVRALRALLASPAGFKGMWGKLMTKAIEEKVIEKRFTFHDLRAYYVTQYKAERKELPDLHANPATTARVYDRTKIVKRRAL